MRNAGRDLKLRNVNLELKAVTDAGEFKGLAAIYDVPDDLGDVIVHGAFLYTLQNLKNQVPMFWNHKLDEPIGFGQVTDDMAGLAIDGKLNLEVTRAREIHSLMKQAQAAGVPFGLSFGFDTIKSKPGQGAVNRYLTEVRLYEVSPTLMPAHPLAQVTGVKSGRPAEGKPFGDYSSFEDCISQNQDKDSPEGFCAYLHQQITGQWPGQKSVWESRINALFAKVPEIRITREQVSKWCASCAEKMATLGLAAISINAKNAAQMPEQLLQGLCDDYAGSPDFFAACVDYAPEVDDPESFCAWLQAQCTGGYPANSQTVLQGLKYLMQTVVLPSARALAAAPYHIDGEQKQLLTDATTSLQQGLMTLMVLLLSAPAHKQSAGEATRRSTSDPAVVQSLATLMREMQAAFRLRRQAVA
jgi:Escherichia/Staphylococcus phage prohead protease